MMDIRSKGSKSKVEKIKKIYDSAKENDNIIFLSGIYRCKEGKSDIKKIEKQNEKCQFLKLALFILRFLNDLLAKKIKKIFEMQKNRKFNK